MTGPSPAPNVAAYDALIDSIAVPSLDLMDIARVLILDNPATSRRRLAVREESDQ